VQTKIVRSDVVTSEATQPSVSDQDLERQFLGDMKLFYGPDPEIMRDHDIAPRSARENEVLSTAQDHTLVGLVRNKLQAGLNECFETLEQMGAAPGAKWGDLITGLYSASGDLAVSSSGGVLLFSTLVQHPVKFILKYWADDPTVGIRPGDVFMHNDARYGNIHNTDQSIMLPRRRAHLLDQCHGARR
jgi:acetone carboxylase alpha subunit